MNCADVSGQSIFNLFIVGVREEERDQEIGQVNIITEQCSFHPTSHYQAQKLNCFFN